MFDGILDNGLKNHARNQAVKRPGVDIFLKFELLTESDHLDPEIVIYKRNLLAQRRNILGFAQKSSQDLGEPVNQRPRAIGIEPDQGRNRVQRVEQEMWIDLICQCNQASLSQAHMLKFELLLRTEAAPDPDWQ